MRTIAVISGILILSGCATTPTLRPSVNATDADRAYCQDEAASTKTGALTKSLIWASNIIVFPITLPLGGLIVYPRDDSERRGDYYRACMERIGYRTAY